jgi:hypothetical protein
MDRRTLIVSGLVTLGAAGVARAQPQGQATSQLPLAPAPAQGGPPPPSSQPDYPANKPGETYSREEIVNNVSDFLGVTAEAAGGAIERIFKDNGRPSAYIAGEEGSGAFGIGARAGRGLLYMKNQQPLQTYWIGPSIGWDVGGNASRVFTLCYIFGIRNACSSGSRGSRVRPI